MAQPWGISHCYCYSPLHCYNSAHILLLCCKYLLNNTTYAQIWGKFNMSLAFDSSSSLCSESQLSCSSQPDWGWDWVMISLSLSLIKLVVSLQSRSSRCGDVGSDRTQNSASELKSSASEDRPRRSRSFNLNIDSVELISSNSSSSLRRRNAHSNDDMIWIVCPYPFHIIIRSIDISSLYQLCSLLLH